MIPALTRILAHGIPVSALPSPADLIRGMRGMQDTPLTVGER